MPHHISSVLLCLTPEQFESFRLAFSNKCSYSRFADHYEPCTTIANGSRAQVGGVKLDPWAVVAIDFVFADSKTVRQRSSSNFERHKKVRTLRYRSPQYINFFKKCTSCCSMANTTQVHINLARCLSLYKGKPGPPSCPDSHTQRHC